MSRVLVTGAGGFIGHHLVSALKRQGHWVRGIDLKHPEFGLTEADEFSLGDLRECRADWHWAMHDVDEVYALAADMGGMGYLTCNQAGVLTANLQISLNTVFRAWENEVRKVIYTSSACVYPEYRQETPDVVPLAEDMAYPAAPDLDYGWEKLTTERLLAAYQDEGRLQVRVARLHNIFGPAGTWHGGREKAPAALCRKAARAPDGGQIEVWGDGQQTRSFCYVSDCVEGLLRLAESDYSDPVNIGSDRLVTIDDLARMAIAASGKNLGIAHVDGPQGVRGRNADLTLCRKVLGWEPQVTLEDGMARTYEWIAAQVRN